MKKSFIPLFMRYSKVPPRPNQKVKYDDPTPVKESVSLDVKYYPEDDESNKSEHEYYHHPTDEVNNPEHEYYYPPTDGVDNYLDDKECMHKPGGNKEMMTMCPLAKSFVCWQTYGKVYSPAEAFRKGTIFPDLHNVYSK